MLPKPTRLDRIRRVMYGISSKAAVTVKRRKIAALIIIATVICVAGVLILPQVDLPDFVIKGGKSLTITPLHIDGASSSFGYLAIVAVVLRMNLHRAGSSNGDTNPLFLPDTFLSRRC